MKRFVALFVLPVVLLLAWFVTPLVAGGKTLILRDILNTHLVDRISLAASLRQFELPLVDPLRAGGQALAGNLNALPFYPDNLLLLFGAGGRATLWALNAHFWLHWFLALAGAFWMGRAFGLARPAAWMAAAAYAFSGYFASQLNLYNTVAGAALAPALVAALLETAPTKSPSVRRRGLLFAGLLWALLLVGGEPLLALLALALAASALVVVAGRRAISWRPVLALVAGTLLAGPQIVEMARILPLSFRNVAGFGEPQAIVGSFRWAHVADLLWPFFFGRPSLSEVLAPQQFDGYPPLLFTLYPGLLALALAGVGALGAFAAQAGERRNRAVLWGVGTAAAGLFFALGRFNPLVAGLWQLPWGRLLHYPAKFWLLAAVGGSLLCGIGFEAACGSGAAAAGARARRNLVRLLALLAGFFVLFLAAATLAPRAVAALVARLLQPGLPAATLALDLVRLQGLALLSTALLLVALAMLRIGRAGRFAPDVGIGFSGWSAALVWLHAATQLWAILPAVPMDDVAPYLERPPILAAIPAGSVVMHGGNQDLFRPGTMTRGDYPDSRILWHTRRAARELYPFAALLHGLRSELAVSPEGLDSFLTQALTVGIRGFSDRRRLDILEALGVDYLLLDRELSPEALGKVREVARDENFGQVLRLYELADRAREVEFATRVIAAPHMNAALEAIFAPTFDPHRTAIVPSGEAKPEAPVGTGAAGADEGTERAQLVANAREEVTVEVQALADGVLFLRRAYLPLWRVEVDRRPAQTIVVQAARLGVAVPAGHHQVRFWIDRRPLAGGLVLALVGALLLAWVVGRRAAGGSISDAEVSILEAREASHTRRGSRGNRES